MGNLSGFGLYFPEETKCRIFFQSSRPVTRFTEDFDFTAMNEKFKKDEVWGHLGKSNKSLTKDKDGNGGDDSEEEGEVELPQTDAKVHPKTSLA